MKEQQTGKATALESQGVIIRSTHEKSFVYTPPAMVHACLFSLMYVISIKGYWTITKLDDGSPFVSWINGHALRLEWTQYRAEFISNFSLNQELVTLINDDLMWLGNIQK